jgi:heme/copper-type cytochrome/quinol oxidase subunit 4
MASGLSPTLPTVPVKTLLHVGDFVTRLVFFAAAPFLLVFIAEIFPVTGAIIQVFICLTVFLLAETARRVAARWRVVQFLLRNQLAFEAYYREHRPRPFLYYVLYPLLFPYWLTVRSARREFWLFKGYTLLTFSALIVSLVFQYRSNFPPELTLRQFLPIAGGSLAAEAVVVLMFLMPIVTTVVHFHAEGSPRRLAVLLLVGIASITIAVVRIERRREPLVSYATRERVRLRSDARPALAEKAQVAALTQAWAALPNAKSDVDSDGKVLGVPLERARAALATYYRSDEAHAFDLWFTRKDKHGLMVLYFEARRNNPPIWLAMDDARKFSHDATKLPKGAFAAMERAAE